MGGVGRKHEFAYLCRDSELHSYLRQAPEMESVRLTAIGPEGEQIMPKGRSEANQNDYGRGEVSNQQRKSKTREQMEAEDEGEEKPDQDKSGSELSLSLIIWVRVTRRKEREERELGWSVWTMYDPGRGWMWRTMQRAVKEEKWIVGGRPEPIRP